MLSSAKLILDFDGTLVVENSSRVFCEVVLEAHRSFTNWLLQRLTGGRLAPIGYAIFGTLGRVLGGRDAKLLVLLWLNRHYLKNHGDEVSLATARRLTLNLALVNEYHQPFEILSTGLEPIIQSFLAIHPEVTCITVTASTCTFGARTASHLLNLADKITWLSQLQSARYYTDYDHEATLLAATLADRVSVSRLGSASPNELYYAEISA